MESSHRKFTVMGGKLKHDVCEYITAMTSESKVEVHVGCDSQNHKRHTVYVTTVVFRFPNNGAHVIYRRCLLYTSPSPRDMRRSRMPSSA